MSSQAEQALMLEALSGDSDRDFPHGMAAMREEARRNPERWEWCISEAARRKEQSR